MTHRTAFAIVALLLVNTSALQAQTIDTRTTGELDYFVTTPNFGQTFTAPDGATFLHNYSFFFASNTSDEDADVRITFRTYLRAVSGGEAVGDVLFSEEREAALCCTQTEEVFDVGAIPVVAGTQYFAYVIPEDGSLVESVVAFGGAYANSYAGGSYAQIQTSCAQLAQSCNLFENPDIDFAFTASFSSNASVVPEPDSLPLLLIGVSLIALKTRRMRSA